MRMVSRRVSVTPGKRAHRYRLCSGVAYTVASNCRSVSRPVWVATRRRSCGRLMWRRKLPSRRIASSTRSAYSLPPKCSSIFTSVSSSARELSAAMKPSRNAAHAVHRAVATSFHITCDERHRHCRFRRRSHRFFRQRHTGVTGHSGCFIGVGGQGADHRAGRARWPAWPVPRGGNTGSRQPHRAAGNRGIVGGGTGRVRTDIETAVIERRLAMSGKQAQRSHPATHCTRPFTRITSPQPGPARGCRT
ncbi:hypothetical protein D3C71_1009500 [compost metagenome]